MGPRTGPKRKIIVDDFERGPRPSIGVKEESHGQSFFSLTSTLYDQEQPTFQELANLIETLKTIVQMMDDEDRVKDTRIRLMETQGAVYELFLENLERAKKGMQELLVDFEQYTKTQVIERLEYKQFTLEMMPESSKAPSSEQNKIGLPFSAWPLSLDDKGRKVPTVLLLLQKSLYSFGGLEAKGIFKDNPKIVYKEEKIVRDNIIKGVVRQGTSIHLLASLIKDWFNELPEGILDSATTLEMIKCKKERHCTTLLESFPPRKKDVLLWLVSMMADFSENVSNDLDPDNLSNLFVPVLSREAGDPFLSKVKKVQVKFFLHSIITRELLGRAESKIGAFKAEK